MVGEASALGLEQGESDGDEIAAILNHPSTPSEGTSTEGDGLDIIIEEAEEASEGVHFSGILEEEDDGWEELL